MKRFALALICALATTVLPLASLQEAAPEAPISGDLTSPTTDMGITGLLTLVGTYGVRRLLGEERLQNKPQILGWTSVATSVLGGAITTYATGGGTVKPWEAIATSLVGWFVAQGGRRVKKLGGVK